MEQGNPLDWVSTHRYHHQYCDSDRDPHSPIEGFWFSHMSWLFDTNSVVQRVLNSFCSLYNSLFVFYIDISWPPLPIYISLLLITFIFFFEVW